jgi:multiple sugar transport system substrate-binding protein
MASSSPSPWSGPNASPPAGPIGFGGDCMAHCGEGISRRDFLKGIAGTGAGLLLGGCRPSPRFSASLDGGTCAERAVAAAQRFRGMSLNVASESGPQAYGLINRDGPLWEKLTGIHVNVVEIGSDLSRFRWLIQEHREGAGTLDCASVSLPSAPDLVDAGVLEPLDDYVAYFMPKGDRKDLLPLFRDLGVWNGHLYGLMDDGDSLLLYFRTDIFEDREVQAKFAVLHGHPLHDPRSYRWDDFVEVLKFLNNEFAPSVHALAPLSLELCWSLFQYRLRLEGGEFFSQASMKPGVASPAGERALLQVQQLLAMSVSGSTIIPQIETGIVSFMSGKSVMAIFWPPLGRWSANPAPINEAFRSAPTSRVIGKTCCSLLPDGYTEFSVGFMLSVMARSPRKEAAYLFCQWLNSPEMSLPRVMASDSLRDPFRISHVRAPEFRKLWPGAEVYLDTLERAGTSMALLDLMMLGANDYEATFFKALTDLRLGSDVKTVLKEMADAWEEITDRLGRSRQRRSYLNFLGRPGASAPPHPAVVPSPVPFSSCGIQPSPPTQ